MLFLYDYAFEKVTDIPVVFFKSEQIKALVLDIDNTLTTHDNPQPADGVLQWLEDVRNAGIKMLVVSNNKPHRVKPFADMLKLEFVANGAKPLTKGINYAVKKMGAEKKYTAAFGDQIFTDVLGANFSGIRMIYVKPIEHEKTMFFKVKRFLEKPFLPKSFIKSDKH